MGVSNMGVSHRNQRTVFLFVKFVLDYKIVFSSSSDLFQIASGTYRYLNIKLGTIMSCLFLESISRGGLLSGRLLRMP